MSLRLLSLLALLPLLAACQGNGLGQAREAAIAASNATLPAPYRDGLVTERAFAGGADLVLEIRFAEARVAQLDTKPHLRDALEADETEAMIELCDSPALKPYLAAGGSVRRRFVDADGALFFEARLPAGTCPTS